ncbi:MAG: hypothetical protein ABIJ96_07985 [Elusimicrobiota bacterium]
MRRLSTLLALVLAVSPAYADDQPVDVDTIAEVLTSAIRPSAQNIRCAEASAKAFAQAKETLARQRAAGRKPHAPAGIIDTGLRLLLRSNPSRLRTGTRWRAWPQDEVYAGEAAEVAKRLEELAANLGPVRTWNCAYDKEAETIISRRLGRLAFKGRLLDLDEPPPEPRLTPKEKSFLDGPPPKLAEAPPARDENSAAWLDWAAAREAAAVMQGLRRRLRPDHKRLREAVRLWSRAAMLKNGAGSAYDPPAKRLDAQTRRVAAAIAKKYGRAPREVLLDCGADEYVFGKISRAAKRLLTAPKE